MTTWRGIEVMSRRAYDVQIRTPPILDGAAPSDREIKGARTLYMADKKTLNAWRKLRGLEAKELGEVEESMASISLVLVGIVVVAVVPFFVMFLL